MDEIVPVKNNRRKIGIVGSGRIGRSWAMLFAAVGYDVMMYDVQESQLQNAMIDIQRQLKELESRGLLRGNLSLEDQQSLITTTRDLKTCIENAFFIQESVPEIIELKKEVLMNISNYIEDDAILSSSTSALMPSLLSDRLQCRNRFIVAHPTNPPFYVPLVELVPAPWTDRRVLEITKSLMEEIGQVPVVLNKEIDGFVLNRIQSAIQGQCWELFRDRIVSLSDLEKVMSAGLGRRYAFMGQIEISYLNSEGMNKFSGSFKEQIYRLLCSFTPPEKFEGETFERMRKEMEEIVPPDEIRERLQWRDRRLASLAKLIVDMEKPIETNTP